MDDAQGEEEGTRSPAPVVTLCYGVAALGWILVSDLVLAALTSDAATLTRFQTLKGLLFVAVTTPLVWFSIDRFWARQMRAHTRARRARRTLDILLSNLPGAVYRARNDPTWTAEYVSAGVQALTGVPARAFLQDGGRSFAEFIHVDDREQVWQTVQAALARREPYVLTYRLQTESGEERWALSQGRGVFTSAGELEAVEGYITDITAQKQLEERYNHARRLEAVGQLAAGMAHDFNNLLVGILGYCELLSSQLEDEPSARLGEHVAGIQAAGERAADLVRQILTFSRRRPVAAEEVELNAWIRATVGLLQRVIGPQVALTVALAPDPIWIRVDPGQLEDILLNLASNARDAMPAGGAITIETRSLAPPASDGAAGAGRALLAVTDTGEGMDERTRARAFEPFFTTKAPGKGTGLGLPTVRELVEQWGGRVAIDSAPGKGARFELQIPLVAASEPAALEAQLDPAEAPRARRGGAPRVLVVDDYDTVRTMVAAALRDAGYEVTTAGSGEAALSRASELGAPFDLLVTDIGLPGMSGSEVARRLEERTPGLAVILITGSGEAEDPEPGAAARRSMLHKPFAAHELLALVAEQLEGEP